MEKVISFKLIDKIDKSLKNNYAIYSIQCSINKKMYIGSSSTIRRRLNQHKYRLKNNIPSIIKLQDDYNKYGVENFIITILENEKTINKTNIIDKENYYINLFKSNNIKYGYNSSTVSKNGGCVHSKQTKEKIRQSAIGRKNSESTRLKISKSNKGKSPAKHTIAAAIKSRIKTVTFINPEGQNVVIENISKFCRENNLNQPCMSDVANGIRNHHKNWRIKQ